MPVMNVNRLFLVVPKALSLCIFIFLFSSSVSSQSRRDSLSNHFVESLRSKPSGDQGTVTIEQEPLVGWLLNKYEDINKADNKISGWRIQIYNSSGKEARDEANELRNKFMNIFSNHKAYLIYQPPFFKIRVGDFRSKQEAFELYKNVLKFFPVSYLVPDKVNYPSLN